MRIIKNNKVIQIDDIFNSNKNDCNIITCTETEYNTLKKENKLDNEKTYLIYTDNLSGESENTYKEEVIFYGYASTKGATYELSKDIHNFDYIEVYGTSCGSLDSGYSQNIVMEKIKVSDIDIYEKEIIYDGSCSLILSTYASEQYRYCIRIRLFDNKLLIVAAGAIGWSNCGVYKVVGIKY